jgi:hypothetical protein
MYRKRELAAVAALLLALTSTACAGGGDNASSEAATQSTSAEPTAATPEELAEIRKAFDGYRNAFAKRRREDRGRLDQQEHGRALRRTGRTGPRRAVRRRSANGGRRTG